jgi:hypothetical protein
VLLFFFCIDCRQDHQINQGHPLLTDAIQFFKPNVEALLAEKLGVKCISEG